MVFVFPLELVVQRLKIKMCLAKFGKYTECFDYRITMDLIFLTLVFLSYLWIEVLLKIEALCFVL